VLVQLDRSALALTWPFGTVLVLSFEVVWFGVVGSTLFPTCVGVQESGLQR
jgi:hypothetical protein